MNSWNVFLNWEVCSYFKKRKNHPHQTCSMDHEQIWWKQREHHLTWDVFHSLRLLLMNSTVAVEIILLFKKKKKRVKFWSWGSAPPKLHLSEVIRMHSKLLRKQGGFYLFASMVQYMLFFSQPISMFTPSSIAWDRGGKVTVEAFHFGKSTIIISSLKRQA